MTTPKPTATVPGAIRTPSSASTVQLYATIRRGLLDYVSPDGERLADVLGDEARVVIGQPPEPVVFPYLTLRLERTTLSAYNGYRETLALEVQAIGRPDLQRAIVETAMDLVDQCLTAWTDARAGGLFVCRARSRATVPPFTTPADHQVVGVVSTFEFFGWPSLLTVRRA